MYDNLQTDPTWTDLDILKITYEEYMAFSRRYFSGQVTETPSPSPSPAERLMIEGGAADSAPLLLSRAKEATCHSNLRSTRQRGCLCHSSYK